MPDLTVTDGLAELTARHYTSLCAPNLARAVLESAFDVGAAVSVADLLPGGEFCLPMWTELCAALVPRGWRSAVVYDERDPRLVLLPDGATADDYDNWLCWWLTVESYGDGTVNVHGGAPAPINADLDLRSWPTVNAALAALDG